MKRNIGKFKVSDMFLEVVDINNEIYKEFLSSFVVLHCEHNFATATFNYTAISKHFRELKDGEMIPEYHVTFEHKYDQDSSDDTYEDRIPEKVIYTFSEQR